MATIQEMARQLRMTYIRDNAEELLRQAEHTKQSLQDFLANLLSGEIERRAENGISRRIADAKFPIKKYCVT